MDYLFNTKNKGMKEMFFQAGRKIMKYLEIDNLLLSWVALVFHTLYPFIFPVQEFLILTLCLVICDAFTGILAAKKQGQKITSGGIRQTVSKITAYFIAILLSEGMRVTFIPEISIPYFVAFIIAIAEFKSNIENVEKIGSISIWRQIIEKFKPNK